MAEWASIIRHGCLAAVMASINLAVGEKRLRVTVRQLP
jgi:hypothetical protein